MRPCTDLISKYEAVSNWKECRFQSSAIEGSTKFKFCAGKESFNSCHILVTQSGGYWYIYICIFISKKVPAKAHHWWFNWTKPKKKKKNRLINIEWYSMKTLKTQLFAASVIVSTSQQMMSHNHGPAPASGLQLARQPNYPPHIILSTYQKSCIHPSIISHPTAVHPSLTRIPISTFSHVIA